VTIALAQQLKQCIPPGSVVKIIKTTLGNMALSEINIESIANRGDALIFKLLPNAEPCKTGELLKRYADLKRFLKSA